VFRWRRGTGVLGVLAALVLAASVLGGCGSSHNQPSPPAAAGGPDSSPSSPSAHTIATTTRIFTPYDRSGAPTAGVVAHRSGSCFAKSITVSTAHAYRCFAANAILDPCFAAPGAKHVLDCYASPWAHAVELRVAKLTVAGAGAHVTRPWAIELAGGLRCVATNGTATFVRGVALTYQCPDGAAGLRAGSTPRAMSALYRASDGAIATRVVVVAWRTTA
jgi:hypothetical protein